MLGALLVSGAFIISSCQKDGLNMFGNSDLAGVADESFVQNESAKIDDIVTLVSYNTFSGERGLINQLPECATVTYDTLSALRKVTVDFGTTPCFNEWDSKYRTGMIIITWTGDMQQAGTVKTITTENYYVGSVATELNKFDLTKTVTNMGVNEDGNVHFAIEVTNAVVTLFDGGTISWTASHDRIWMQGTGTPDPDDDLFNITGGSQGTDSNGESFTVEITAPLVKNACEWIVSGVKTITHGNDPQKVIDYGNGECDDIAIVTVNGNQHIIHLN